MTLTVEAFIADHPARGDDILRPVPIRRTYSPHRVAVIIAYRDAAARQAHFWQSWGMIRLSCDWAWKAMRAQAVIERIRG